MDGAALGRHAGPGAHGQAAPSCWSQAPFKYNPMSDKKKKILSNFDFNDLAAPRTDSAATDSGLSPATLARRFGFPALAELIEQAPRAKFKRERQILPPVEVKQENVIVTIFGENDEGKIKSKKREMEEFEDTHIKAFDFELEQKCSDKTEQNFQEICDAIERRKLRKVVIGKTFINAFHLK